MPYPAYCHLPEGAILRYDPYEDSIRTLAYPATPSAWDEAPLFYGEAPRDGWRHLFGCECERCRPEEGTQSAGRGSWGSRGWSVKGSEPACAAGRCCATNRSTGSTCCPIRQRVV